MRVGSTVGFIREQAGDGCANGDQKNEMEEAEAEEEEEKRGF